MTDNLFDLNGQVALVIGSSMGQGEANRKEQNHDQDAKNGMFFLLHSVHTRSRRRRS